MSSASSRARASSLDATVRAPRDGLGLRALRTIEVGDLWSLNGGKAISGLYGGLRMPRILKVVADGRPSLALVEAC